jgi:hypothetical protein
MLDYVLPEFSTNQSDLGSWNGEVLRRQSDYDVLLRKFWTHRFGCMFWSDEYEKFHSGTFSLQSSSDRPVFAVQQYARYESFQIDY